MSDTNILSLSGIPVETLYQAFLEAFCDYEIKITISLERFEEMMKTRSLNLDLSRGCFIADKLVAFVLVGFRTISGIPVCYDIGTGVIRDHRKQGLAGRLLESLLDTFEEKGIRAFILEVLTSNEPAIQLYKKHGFDVTRRLNCYQLEKRSLALVEPSLPVRHDTEIFSSLAIDQFLDSAPSWQNDTASILNSLESYAFSFLQDEGRTVAFGVVHINNGDIPLFGVLPSWRHKGLEREILSLLAASTASENLRVLNLDEQSSMNQELAVLGFSSTVGQFEMRRDL